MLVRGASCICLSPKLKQSTGRRRIFGLVLAPRGDVLCNTLVERGANKSDGWGLGGSAARWSILPPGGELMQPKAEARSVLRRAVPSACIRKVSPVWWVPGDQQEGQKADTRSVLRSAVSSTRSWKVFRLCGTCSATNRRGPSHHTAVVVDVVGGRALPRLKSHPRRNRGCGLDGRQKQNRYEKKIGEIGETLPQ